MAGVDIRTIAQLTGHATIQMSMRYAHLSPDHNQATLCLDSFPLSTKGFERAISSSDSELETRPYWIQA
jgi:hypothetical protein